MSTVTFARALMGTSLAFHIVYTAIGIGLPLMLMIAEWIALRTGQEVYHQISRRWIRTASVLFAIGAVSGTILSFELGLLWPEFMRYAGALIGLPFSLEGFAFFTEAIFLGLYLYGERRLSRRALFLSTIPMTIAAAASAVFVISANAWMNTPAGFQQQGGRFVQVSPLQAMANPAWLHEALHGTLSSYVAAGFAVAGVYAVKLLRGRATEYNKRALTLALAVGTVFLPFMLLSGDMNARFLARFEQAKFAAMEGLFKTTQGAPLVIGGWPDPATQEIRYGISIPKMLSLLGFHDPNATVKGLADMAPGTTPDPRPVHLTFDLMVGSFFIMLLGAAWFWWLCWRRKQTPATKWPLRALVAASPFGFVALESGWMVTEFGRQPWVAAGLMRVSEGVTPRTGIEFVFLAFVLVYIALTIGLIWLLLYPSGARTAPPTPPGGRYVANS